MRRQVWSAEEIRDVLLAAGQASGLSLVALSMGDKGRETLQAYCQGFRAALLSLATAFGVAQYGGNGANVLSDEAMGDNRMGPISGGG